MILTQATATALQNKKGLAFGNQILGWGVLGTYFLVSIDNSRFFGGPIPAHQIIQSPLPPPSGHHFPRLRSNIHNPHNLLRRTFLRDILHNPRPLERTRNQSRKVGGRTSYFNKRYEWTCSNYE